MKKYLLLFVFAIVFSVGRAQNGELYSLLYHEWPGHYYNGLELMQQSDGDIIIDTYVFEDIGGPDVVPIGHMFYKISHDALAVTDSLFIADTTMSSRYIMVQNPYDEGNTLVRSEYHENGDSTFMRLSHFPNSDLHINPNEDILMPVCEGNAIIFGVLVDRWGDLIVQYYKEIDPMHYNDFVARFGFDGTLKSQALLHENVIWGQQDAGLLRMLKESPLEYFQWGNADSYNGPYRNLAFYEIDSLFNNNPLIISSILSEEPFNQFYNTYEYLKVQYGTEVISIGGDEILVAAEYAYIPGPDHTDEEFGVVVAKYDIRTMQQKGYVVFNDYPGMYKPAQCLGIKMMTDGTVYFFYKEDGYPEESFIAVKMDTDLNVEKKRFCKTGDIIIHWPILSSVKYKDGQGGEQGVAWLALASKTNGNNYGWVYLFFNHEGPVATNEVDITVRPYTFYPNPAKDQLHTQFSPDVQPVQVELYDLQGRLVHTQRSAFETIDLSRLPAGTYTMRVVMKDGKTYSDKVVKE